MCESSQFIPNFRPFLLTCTLHIIPQHKQSGKPPVGLVQRLKVNKIQACWLNINIVP